MNEDPEGISPGESVKRNSASENRRAKRGGDPEGISPGERHRAKRGGDQQAEGLAVNAEDV